MAETFVAQNTLSDRLTRSWNDRLNGFHARVTRPSRKATTFVSQPEPRAMGQEAAGRQLMAGNFLFAGHLVTAPDTSIWDVEAPDDAFRAAVMGFGWLDDLAAVGDYAARELAQTWLDEWIARYGRGTGPGWVPDLTGRRIIRWINHAIFLLRGRDKADTDLFFASLTKQARFLKKRWHAAGTGLPRFEALTGMIYAGLSLEGMDDLVDPARDALADECVNSIDTDGGIPTRNPEELLEVFTLLTWAAATLTDEDRAPRPEHQLAIERIAPTLRALRHADGTLARFHGGGATGGGRVDNALAMSGVRATAHSGLAMGYARLAAGRTSIIMDAGVPPTPEASANAHASTLAFELTSSRQPVIVNCGSGAAFGTNWHRAGRATPSHSTLGIDGYSSSRFGPRSMIHGSWSSLLSDGPTVVQEQQSQGLDGMTVLATHNGWSHTHGLVHVRRLDLALDGRELAGEDTLAALSEADRIRFEQMMDENGLREVTYAVRFHLHPDIEAAIDMANTAISLAQSSGEIWVFKHNGAAEMSLEPSVYLEAGRLKPRATKQVVLTSSVVDYAGQVSWTLTRAQDAARLI